jgi:hypothetical protein
MMKSRWNAALSALLTGACGGVATSPDASPSDAPPGPPDAIVAGDVTVNAQQLGAGAIAYFFDPDGSVVDEVSLPPSGLATRALLPGGAVSVVDEANGNAYHFTGVQPGEELRVNSPSMFETQLDVTFTVPSLVGATDYYVRTPCGSGVSNTTTVAVTLYDCGDTTDVVVVAAADPERTIFKAAVEVEAAMTISAAYKPKVPGSVEVTGVPAAIDTLEIYTASTTLAGQLYVTSGLYGYADPAEGALTATGMLPDVPDLWQVGSVYSTSDLGSQAVQFRSQGADLAFVLSEQRSPHMRNVAIDGAEPALIWTSVGQGAEPNLAIAQYSVDDGVSTFYHYLVGAPEEPGHLGIPSLPAPYEAWNPTPTSGGELFYARTVATDAVGASEIRQRYFQTYDNTPADGVAVVAYGELAL